MEARLDQVELALHVKPDRRKTIVLVRIEWVPFDRSPEARFKETVVPVQHADPAKLAETLKKRLGDTREAAVIGVITREATHRYPALNFVVIRATARKAEEIKEMIRKLDEEARPPSRTDREAGRKKAEEWLAAAKKIAAETEIRYEAGRVSLDEVIEAKLQVCRAELDLCETDKERVGVYEKIVALAKELETVRNTQFEAGRITPAVLGKAKADRLEAETALERAKAKAAGRAK